MLPALYSTIIIKEMDKNIRTHFRFEKRKRVRKRIVPGNSGSLWKAVNIAKDVGVCGIPDRLHLRGVPVGDGLIPDTFADFFESKVNYCPSQRHHLGIIIEPDAHTEGILIANIFKPDLS